MEAEDPLSQLADIHLPADVPFWPPAPGWWALGGLLLLGLAMLAWTWFRHWQQTQRLKRALQALDAAHSHWARAHKTDPNAAGLALLYAINALLKRIALQHHAASRVAPLTGRAWLAFLDAEGATADFSQGLGRVLAEGEYRRQFDADAADVEALCALVRRWIIHRYRQQPGGLRAVAAPAGVEA